MDILISGASIAGPAVAYWLRHHGYRPTIVEHAEGIRDAGYAVDLRGDALEVLDRMNILDQIRQHDTQMNDAALMDADGEQYATLPAAIFAGELEILKGDLTRILYDSTHDDVDYIFGDSIASLRQDDAGVHVTFERGQPRTFDLVVGADGLHSRTRGLAFGPETRYIRHLGIYTAIIEIDNYLGLRNTGQLYSVPGKAANIFSARDNTEARAALHFASAPLHYDRDDIDEHKRIVTEQFANEGWEVPRLLREIHAATDFYFDAYAQVEMTHWSNGRVVLLGDAGYCAAPTSGWGTSQALIGAYVLAGELAAAGGDHATAFTRYQQRLHAQVADSQQAGREGAEVYFLGKPTQQMLDAIAALAAGTAPAQANGLRDYP